MCVYVCPFDWNRNSVSNCLAPFFRISHTRTNELFKWFFFRFVVFFLCRTCDRQRHSNVVHVIIINEETTFFWLWIRNFFLVELKLTAVNERWAIFFKQFVNIVMNKYGRFVRAREFFWFWHRRNLKKCLNRTECATVCLDFSSKSRLIFALANTAKLSKVNETTRMMMTTTTT